MCLATMAADVAENKLASDSPQCPLGRLVMLMVVNALAGCASALAPMPALPLAEKCAPIDDGQNCVTRGRQAFTDYRRAKVREILDKSDGSRLASAPVAFIDSQRTEYSVLLVHGLNDSAYYMADLGEVLNRSGFNVISVLLPGHGTNTREMLKVSAEQWRAEVDRGLEMAALVGRKVIVGGFSLGAALAIDTVLRRDDIYGLLLFSPAIKLRSFDAVASLACIPGLRSLVLETELPPNPVKYKYRVGNSVCQLTRLLRHNLTAEDRASETSNGSPSEPLQDLARRVKVPTFVAFSFSDQRISPAAALEFAGNIPAPVLVATFGMAEDRGIPRLSNGQEIRVITDASLPHSYLVRRHNPYNGQEDPCFDRLAGVLGEFLAEHFHARRDSGNRGLPDCLPVDEALHGTD